MVLFILIVSLLQLLTQFACKSTEDFSNKNAAEATWKTHPLTNISQQNPVEAYDTFSSLKFNDGKLIQKHQIIELVYTFLKEDSKWSGSVCKVENFDLKASPITYEYEEVLNSLYNFVNLKSYNSFGDLMAWKSALEVHYLETGIPAFFERDIAKESVSVSKEDFKTLSNQLFNQISFVQASIKFYQRLSRQFYGGFNLLKGNVMFIDQMMNSDCRFMSLLPVKEGLSKLSERFNSKLLTAEMTPADKSKKIVELFWLTIMSDDFCEVTLEAFAMYANQIFGTLSESNVPIETVCKTLLLKNYLLHFAQRDLFGLKYEVASVSGNILVPAVSHKISALYLERNHSLLDEFVCQIVARLPKDFDFSTVDKIFIAILDASHPHSLFLRKGSFDVKEKVEQLIYTATLFRLDLQNSRPAKQDIELAYMSAYGTKSVIQSFLAALQEKTNNFDLKKLVEVGKLSYVSKNWRQLVIGAVIVLLSTVTLASAWALSIMQPWRKKNLKN